jgi:hypothetical protein
MSALAQAYANTGNAALQTKGAYLVSSLAACQAVSPAAGYHTGYLSAYPENFFDRLESGQQVWAPYYTIHKIMAGPHNGSTTPRSSTRSRRTPTNSPDSTPTRRFPRSSARSANTRRPTPRATRIAIDTGVADGRRR